MDWLLDLYRTSPAAQAIAVISLVCMAGMVLGSFKLHGVGLGTAGVLFAGILVGSVSHPIDHETLEFVKQLGLILFVFCIGLQLGPGFFASLRQMGMRLHLMAVSVVLLGTLLAAGLGWLLGMDYAAVLGVLAGATTNTPSLGAAQQTLAELPGVSAERAALPALAYAVSYPQVVGQEDRIGEAAALLGNSIKALNQTHFVPLFAGFLAGIALGTLPLAIPGCPQPLRLGLAGGPLIVAILVSRVGRIGPLVWHMPLNANLAFREFGIALFFASVGLMAGPQFFAVVFSARGAIWVASGICVTVLPILFVGWLALVIWRMNFVVVSGVIAGSMTDSSAPAFATNICGAEKPMVAYAAVYPLTTLMRMLAAQILTVVLCG